MYFVKLARVITKNRALRNVKVASDLTGMYKNAAGSGYSFFNAPAYAEYLKPGYTPKTDFNMSLMRLLGGVLGRLWGQQQSSQPGGGYYAGSNSDSALGGMLSGMNSVLGSMTPEQRQQLFQSLDNTMGKLRGTQSFNNPGMSRMLQAYQNSLNQLRKNHSRGVMPQPQTPNTFGFQGLYPVYRPGVTKGQMQYPVYTDDLKGKVPFKSLLQ